MPDRSERHADARRTPWAGRHGFGFTLVFVVYVVGPGRCHVAAQHAVHPPMPDQRYVVQLRPVGGDPSDVTNVALDLSSPTAPAVLGQDIELFDGGNVIRAVRYLPRAAMEQTVVPDVRNRQGPAMLLAIKGPTQSFQRWLIADDPDRNRLQSLIATWRFVVAADAAARNALYTQFEKELTRDPILRVRSQSMAPVHEIAAVPGRREILPDNGCTLEVIRFLPHFAIDDKTKSPVSVSEKRLNPAAQIRLSCSTKTTERWVFARFPEYTPGGEDPLPVRIQLDCPVDAERSIPAFVLMTSENAKHEVWERFDGKTRARPLMLDRAVEIANSSYSFRVREFVTSARLVETYKPNDGRRAVPAVQFRMQDAKYGDSSFWIALGRNRAIETSAGRVLVSLAAQEGTSTGGHP